MTERDLSRIPAGNIAVPVGEFGVLWRAAERRTTAQGERGITDWSAGGIAMTCRWAARAVSETPNRRRVPTPAPVTGRRVLASEETIEAEFVAAEKLLARTPPSALVSGQPGYVEAVSATLRWAWRASGPMPAPLPSLAQ